MAERPDDSPGHQDAAVARRLEKGVVTHREAPGGRRPDGPIRSVDNKPAVRGDAACGLRVDCSLLSRQDINITCPECFCPNCGGDNLDPSTGKPNCPKCIAAKRPQGPFQRTTTSDRTPMGIAQREPHACGHDVCLDRDISTCMFKPMCNDSECPMRDFPHDPHQSGSPTAGGVS